MEEFPNTWGPVSFPLTPDTWHLTPWVPAPSLPPPLSQGLAAREEPTDRKLLPVATSAFPLQPGQCLYTSGTIATYDSGV
jgi:hypothetical protein